MSMKITAELTVYEIDGVATSPMVGDGVPKLKVQNHFIKDTLCILTIDGKAYTVSCDELSKAVSASQKALL